MSGPLTLSGHASVTDRPYDMGWYRETIQRGAFAKTLRDNPQVHLLVNHEGLPLASTTNGTLQLSEDDVGLRFDATLDPEDPDSQAVVRKVRSGLMQECSFAFQAVRQDWNDDYSERIIREVSISKGDVSLVNFAANPAAQVAPDGLDDPPSMSSTSDRSLRMARAEKLGRRLVGRETRGLTVNGEPALSVVRSAPLPVADYTIEARARLQLAIARGRRNPHREAA